MNEIPPKSSGSALSKAISIAIALILLCAIISIIGFFWLFPIFGIAVAFTTGAFGVLIAIVILLSIALLLFFIVPFILVFLISILSLIAVIVSIIFFPIIFPIVIPILIILLVIG